MNSNSCYPPLSQTSPQGSPFPNDSFHNLLTWPLYDNLDIDESYHEIEIDMDQLLDGEMILNDYRCLPC